MELSSPKFELLGGSRVEERILKTCQDQKPKNGIRFQVKTILEAGKTIAKNVETGKQPGSRRHMMTWTRKSRQIKPGRYWMTYQTGQRHSSRQKNIKGSQRSMSVWLSKVTRRTKSKGITLAALQLYTTYFSTAQRSFKTELLNTDWPLEAICAKTQAPPQTKWIIFSWAEPRPKVFLKAIQIITMIHEDWTPLF